MFTVKNFVFLALAGTAIAAPQRGNGHWSGGPPSGWSSGWNWGGHSTSTTSSDNQVVTQTATVQPVPATPTPTTDQPTGTESPTATASPSTGGGSSSGTGSVDYMSVVNEWRSKMGLSQLTQDSTLQGNDQKTVDDDKGVMTHELNSGSFAQVLAPGDDTVDGFTKCFVGGWLCEVPSTPGLDGICDTMSQGWAYNGETGHNAILTSKSYSKIGCAYSDGLWGCDLA